MDWNKEIQRRVLRREVLEARWFTIPGWKGQPFWAMAHHLTGQGLFIRKIIEADTSKYFHSLHSEYKLTLAGARVLLKLRNSIL